MTDATYTLYGIGPYKETAIHRNIVMFNAKDYSGGISVYEADTPMTHPEAVYAPGQWSVLIKDETGAE